VRTRALEIWRITFGDLMDVHGMLAGRKILDIQFDAHALGRTAEGRGTYGFVLSVLDGDHHGLVMRGIILRKRREAETREQRTEAGYAFHDYTPLTEQDRRMK
jgi:hypothetical protein